MRRRPLWSLLILTGLAATSCGEQIDVDQRVRGFLARTEARPFEYSYSETAGGRRVEIRGRVEDSFRHSEVLSLNGKQTLERVVSDDSMAIHVSFPEGLDQVAKTRSTDPPALAALQAGQWVTDPAGAPPTGSESRQLEQVGANPLVDAVNLFRYARLAIREAAGIFEFNPDALNYIPEEDPFPHPDKKAGETRFDLVAPELPTAESGRFPVTAHFRKMSIYVAKGRVTRILEVIDIRGHREFRRARETGRNPFLLQLQRDAEAGRGPEKIRPRQMAFEILTAGEPLKVEPAGALTGNLRGLFPTKEEEGGGQVPPLPEEPGIPVVPLPSPPQGEGP